MAKLTSFIWQEFKMAVRNALRLIFVIVVTAIKMTVDKDDSHKITS
jgi:hypothetical protein